MRRRTIGMALAALSCFALSVATGTDAKPLAVPTDAGPHGAPNLPASIPARQAARPATTKLIGSFNWSGYARSTKRKNTFTGVTATFPVTTVNTTVAGTQYSADWVGIGGVRSKDLIQAGVEEDNLGGTASYQAWTEILPAPVSPLALTVSPGDTMTVTILETAVNQWSMTVDDDTTSTGASRVVAYTSTGKSVEAVAERPCITAPCTSTSDLATLATTTDAIFDPVQFTSSTPGASPVYSPLLSPTPKATLYDIVMISSDLTNLLAFPSSADSDLDGFTVADGSGMPAPPNS